MPIEDISGLLPSAGIELEHQALNMFGAAVAGTTGSRMSNGFTAQPDSPGTGSPGPWDITRFASGLVWHDTVPFNPKLKFLFKISFQFDPAMLEKFPRLRDIQTNFTFLVRHIDRPKFDFEYEEVNLYNFRTKVLKTIKHREVSFTVYDDVGNYALSFVNIYRQLLSPIANRQFDPSLHHEDHGFDFKGNINTSMRSTLPGDVRNVLQSMTIHQIFVERGSDMPSPSAWVKTVNFVFMNPRFTGIDIDDLDHEVGGNFNLITFTADFDNVFMAEAQHLTTDTDAPAFNLGDITTGQFASAGSAQGGANNPMVEQMFTQGIRAQAGIPFVGTTDGGASNVGQLSGVLGSLEQAGERTIKSMISNKVQAFATSAIPHVVDSNVPPSLSNAVTKVESSVVNTVISDIGGLI